MSCRLFTAIRLLRPQSVFLMCLFLVIPIGIHSRSIPYAVVQVLPFYLLLCGEIALNDACDIEKDRVNKPQRPLVSGNLSRSAAFVLAIFVIFTSVICGVLLYQKHLWRQTIFVGVLLILSLYNVPGKLMPIIKAFLTASATVLALSFLLTYNSLQHPFLFLSGAFSFILGRELLMDIRDFAGDQLNEYITIAILLGKKKTFIVASSCFGLSLVLCSLMLLSNSSPLQVLGVFLFAITTIILVLAFSRTDDTKWQNRIALLLWLPILEMLLYII